MDEKEDKTFQSEEKSESEPDTKIDEKNPIEQEEAPPMDNKVSGIKEPKSDPEPDSKEKEETEPKKQEEAEKEKVPEPQKEEKTVPEKEEVPEPEKEEKTVPIKEEVQEPEKEEKTVPIKEEVPEPEKEEKTVPIKEEAPKPEKIPIKKPIIIEEVEKKPKLKIVNKIKRAGLVAVLIIILILIGGIYAWTSGMDDLSDDNDYLLVVVYKDVPKAASIYHKDTEESEIVEVIELGALSNTNRKGYFKNAQEEYGVLDRMIIIDVATLKDLSTDEYIIYETGDKIYVDDMSDWIMGTKYPTDEIKGDDEPSMVRAKILKAWVDHYSEQLLGSYGSYTAKVVLNAYRSEKIVIYPGNSALFILRYIAIEKIFLPL